MAASGQKTTEGRLAATVILIEFILVVIVSDADVPAAGLRTWNACQPGRLTRFEAAAGK